MKHYLRFMITLLLTTVWSLGGYAQETVTIWSEDWTGQKTGELPSSINTIYSQNNNGTKIFNESTGGGTAPELLLKKSDKWTITISDLKGCSGDITLSYHSNRPPTGSKALTVTINNSKLSVSADEKDKNLYKGTYSLPDGTSEIKIVFSAADNARIDDIVLTGTKSSSGKTSTTLTFPQTSYSFATTDDLSSFKGQTATLTAGDETLTGKTITYEKTGDDIFSSFDESTGALSLNGKAGKATIKATFDGSKDDTYNSSSASYTIEVKQVYSDLASFKAAIPSSATSSNPVSYSLKLTDALVTYVNGTDAYVQDATTGVLLYDASKWDATKKVSTGNAFDLTAGQKFTGNIDVTACMYNSMAEITAWTPATGVDKVENVEIPVKTVTLAELNGSDYSKYECVRIKVENATVTTAYSTSKKATITQGDQSYLIHGEVNGLDVNKDDVCDFVGYPIYWKTNSLNEHQLSIWSQDDITVKSSVVATTLSFDSEKTEFTVDKKNASSFVSPKATVKDADNNVVEGAKVTYKSSNTDVATVAENGTVSFVGFGTTTITASYAGDATHKAAKDISYTIIYGKVKTTMAWSANEATAKIGEDFTAPTLSLTADGESILEGKTISYESEDENVAAFVDGTLDIRAEGTTIITAKFAGDDTYAEATASYTLTVVDPNKMEVTFDFTDPTTLGYEKPANGKGIDLGEGTTITSGVVTLKNEKDGDNASTRFWNSQNIISLRAYDGAKLSISVPSGYYITKVVYNDDKNCNNFTTDSGDLNIETQTWTGNANSIMMTFKGGSGQFSCITVSYSESSKPEPTSGTLNFVAKNEYGYYATFSSDKDVVFTNDVVVSGVGIANEKLNLNDFTADIYNVTDATAGEDKDGAVEGYYVPANTGVLVYSTDATAPYYFPKTAETPTLPANQLKPAPVDGGVFKAEDGHKYYKLAYNDYDAKTGLGFYWGADNGGAFKVKAGTAYLAVPTSDANAKCFTFDGGTTGINEVTTNDSKVKNIYNLNGQRVENMSHAGLYIVNGKKVVIRK